QDPAERFDIVHADGSPTGRTKARGDVHRDGDWHRAVHVWVMGEAAGASFLLFQRRSARKDTWPGRLDATVGGHLRAGETAMDALREIEEEIGVAAPPAALRPLGVRVCANEGESGVLDRELQDVFLLRDDRPLTAYRLHPAEVAALVSFPLPALLTFLAGETDAIDGIEIAAAAASPNRRTCRRDDFIPTIDRYFYRVAIAADAALRGERHAAV
ncbi:MAG TPA: NUDIX domain-containing protein, partial [Thermomicrobiales bacterium]|nr:NUDIX domain-containing protein [Thermomicrobiales bacterium]